MVVRACIRYPDPSSPIHALCYFFLLMHFSFMRYAHPPFMYDTLHLCIACIHHSCVAFYLSFMCYTHSCVALIYRFCVAVIYHSCVTPIHCSFVTSIRCAHSSFMCVTLTYRSCVYTDSSLTHHIHAPIMRRTHFLFVLDIRLGVSWIFSSP